MKHELAFEIDAEMHSGTGKLNGLSVILPEQFSDFYFQAGSLLPGFQNKHDYQRSLFFLSEIIPDASGKKVFLARRFPQGRPGQEKRIYSLMTVPSASVMV